MITILPADLGRLVHKLAKAAVALNPSGQTFNPALVWADDGFTFWREGLQGWHYPLPRRVPTKLADMNRELRQAVFVGLSLPINL